MTVAATGRGDDDGVRAPGTADGERVHLALRRHLAARREVRTLNVPSRWNSLRSCREASAPISETFDSLRNVGTATVRASTGTADRQL